MKANTGDHVPPIGSLRPRPQFTLSQLMLWTALIGVLLGSWRLATSLDPIAAGVAASCCLLGLAIAWYVAAPAGRMWAVLSATAGGPLLLGFLAAGFDDAHRTPSMRHWCANNLKQIGVALHAYHDDYKCFPPAHVADEKGRPMHSWRVLLLPYLEQQHLYDQYRFDEPWDGPNNSRLHGLVVETYQCPGTTNEPAKPDDTQTSYVVVVGPHTSFPGTSAISLQDIKDDPSTVIAIVEVQNSGIHWMEPRDLHVTQMAPGINPAKGQGISSKHGGGANVVMADGSVKYLDAEKLSAEDVLSLLTIDGNEPPPIPRD